MGFFKNVFKKEDASVSSPAIPAEIYKSVHVMQDDINDIQGRPSEKMPIADSSDEKVDASHPFLGSNTTPMEPKPFDAPEKKLGADSIFLSETLSQKESLPVPSPERITVATQRGGYGKLLVPAIVSILIIIIGAVSAFFYFRIKEVRVPASETAIPTESSDVDVSADLPFAPASEFSLENPNYLVLDPESTMTTPEGISGKISEVGTKVREAQLAEPIEFLVRDANGNPIAFSRFAYLAKLAVPEEILSLLDETFSFYVVPDGGEVRFAFALEVKDEAKLSAAIAKEEASLPTWFGGILYDSSIQIPMSVSFRNGMHGTIETKFMIIDAEKNYSLDYAFIGKKWILGTSKDSFHAVLEEIVMKKTE